jgi:hypothetical protein
LGVVTALPTAIRSGESLPPENHTSAAISSSAAPVDLK